LWYDFNTILWNFPEKYYGTSVSVVSYPDRNTKEKHLNRSESFVVSVKLAQYDRDDNEFDNHQHYHPRVGLAMLHTFIYQSGKEVEELYTGYVRNTMCISV
jgi:hypothetical protein